MGRVRLAALAGSGLAAAGLAAAALAAEPGAAAEPIPRGLLSPRGIGGIKAGVATLATVWLAWGWWLERQGRAAATRRIRDVGLALLGVAGAACWWNLFQFHYPGFGHPSDTFHYYLGAKYFPELRYTRLYACTAVADAEDGAPADRRLRDLETNALVPSAGVLADPDACRRHFSPERWAAFRADVAFLRERTVPRRWQRFQQDHGYNATPAWGVLGRAVTSTGPASEGQLAWLRALDPLLLAAMAGAIAWAFGWRILCVAAVWFGTNYAAPYGWTGGAILRQDWLFATVTGLCLLRRGWPASGGALLALAAALRIFPALVLLGVAAGAVGRMVRERRPGLTGPEWRVAAGAVACGLVLLPLSAAVAGGVRAWPDFFANARVHLATPLANHVGLRTVLSHDPAVRSADARDASLDDPMAPWKQARRERFARFEGLFWALVAGFGVLVARAAAREPLWVGGVLGVAWIPVAVELTGYYWSVLLALALLAERRASMAPALCGLAAAGWGVASLWHWTDEIHVWLSVLTVSFCVYTVLLVTPRPSVAAAGEAPPTRA